MMTQKKMIFGVGVLATLALGAPILGDMAEHVMMAGVSVATGERVEYVTTREADKNRAACERFFQNQCDYFREHFGEEGVRQLESHGVGECN